MSNIGKLNLYAIGRDILFNVKIYKCQPKSHIFKSNTWNIMKTVCLTTISYRIITTTSQNSIIEMIIK